MPTELTLPLVYDRADVLAGQRLRFRHSARLRVLAVLSVAAVVFLAVQEFNPALLGAPQPMSWQTAAAFAAAFVLFPVFFYLFVPMLDYRSNPAWRQAYTLTVGKGRLRLVQAGMPRGFELVWPAVRQVLEDDRVFLLFFKAKDGMVMIPKRTFTSPEQADFFRRLATKG